MVSYRFRERELVCGGQSLDIRHYSDGHLNLAG